MDALLERLRSAAPSVFDGEPVDFAILFGSQALGTDRPGSDIDVAVGLRPGTEEDRLELRFRLAAGLERAIGVGPVEVVVLDDSPLTLAGRVQQEGRLFYCADEPRYVRYASLTSRMYHDYKIREERSARDRLTRLARGH